tara:strand:- start:348 stop:509 length:162 start_codon:yes stop_codon:yes gene_type:complete
MSVRIKAAKKKVLDGLRIEVTRWKTDSVDHQGIDGDPLRAIIAMWRTKAGVAS